MSSVLPEFPPTTARCVGAIVTSLAFLFVPLLPSDAQGEVRGPQPEPQTEENENGIETQPSPSQDPLRFVPKPESPGLPLRVESVEIEPEEIYPGDTVELSFRLRNVGEEAVIVTGATPLTPDLELVGFEPSIEPGSSDTVRFRRRIQPGERGAGTFRADLHLEGEKTPVRLEAEVEVRSPVVAEPGYAQWVYVQGEGDAPIPQTLRSRDETPFAIRAVESPRRGLRVEVAGPFPKGEEPVEAGELFEESAVWTLDLVLEEDAPVGPITGAVDVRLDHPEQDLLQIPISGFVRPVLAVTPNELRATSEVQIDETLTEVLDVRIFSTDPVEILRVEDDMEGVTTEIEAVAPGRRYEIRVRFSPEIPEGPLRGTIRIHTGSAFQSVVEVPVEGIIG